MLRRRGLQRLLQFFQRRPRKHRAARSAAGDTGEPRLPAISSTPFRLRELRCRFAHCRRRFRPAASCPWRSACSAPARKPWSWLPSAQAVDHHQLAVLQLRRQRRAQRTQQLLARERVVIGAWLRPVDRAAMPPQRRTDRRDTRPARALLLPQLLARAAHQTSVLGGVRFRRAGRRGSASPLPKAGLR